MSTARYPDRTYYSRIANESGFRAEPLETVFRLADLLSRLTREVGAEILLRGGTALNLLYLDLPRLSVDIDLDFVGATDANDARRRRPELLAVIEEVAVGGGYEVRPERESYAMSHRRMHYTNASGRPAFLKVDVNFLDRVPVLPPEMRTVRHPFSEDLPTLEVQTFALPELAASKLIALARRFAARDLFDVAMFSDVVGIDAATLKTLVVVRGASYPPPSPDAYDAAAVDAIKPMRWRSEVMALARRPVAIDLIEAKERSSRLIEGLSQLDDGHLDFLRALDDGEIRADSLSVPETTRVMNNPGLLWRLKMGIQALEER